MGCCASHPTLPPAAAPSSTNPTAPRTTSIVPSGGDPTTSTLPQERNSVGFPPHSRTPSHVSSRNGSFAYRNSSAGNAHPERQGSGAARPNRPLRAPSPVATCPAERALAPWTASRLGREREAFFDTRVTGDPEVWAALRVVCEMLRADDVQGAQSILDAVGLTCPTGRIKAEKPARGGSAGAADRRKGGVFDEQGRGYEIPGWVVSDPDDLVPEEEEMMRGEKEGVGESESEEDEEDGEGGGGDEGADTVKVRARLSDKGIDVVVEVGAGQKVRVLVRRLEEEVGGRKKMRLLYLGKILREDQSLREQGWQDGHVVNALVFD